MIFAEYVPPPPSEARDLLAWWSDVLGIAGFVLTIVGLWIALFIKREVSRAKREARTRIAGLLQSQRELELIETRRFLELSREACGSKRWVRAEVYFDAAEPMLTRLLSATPSTDDETKVLQIALDNIRLLNDAVRGRLVKNGPLSQTQMRHLGDTIHAMIRVEARLTAQRLGEVK